MHIAILGNGISGVTAARFIRKLDPDCRISIISAETDHFFSRTALMYIYMGHMTYQNTKPYEDFFWEKNRLDLVRGYVREIDFSNRILHFDPGRTFDTSYPAPQTLTYDKLVLAVGSAYNKFGWPGQDLQGVGGMVSFQDLQYMEDHSPGLQRAVVVGGGLIGIEMAEMFHSRHIPVTMLVREEQYWNNVLPGEEARMVSSEIRRHGIDLRLGAELREILDDGSGRARAVVTKQGEEIPCGFVGLTAGVHPNISWLKDTELETEKGILVDEYLQTNLPGVYAIGDCAQLRQPPPGRRPIEAVWYVGRMMGETVAYTVCGKPTAYRPGIWFNSAKFMDIEYQVYGDVPTDLPESLQTLYWEHTDGRRSVRLVYERTSGVIRGFNLMGVRFRQAVCEKWIAENASVEEVLQDLSLANFDPEFYRQYETAILQQYNEQSGRDLSLRKKRSWRQVFSFLHQPSQTS